MNSTPTQALGPVTIDDVRAALGDTDPNATNAGALRTKLGRGSTSTIQKHLDRLRADRLPATSVEAGAPTAPADAVAAIWGAAWSAAQAQTLGRLAQVTQERDAARERIAVLTADLDAATAGLDTAQEQLATTLADADSRVAAAAAQGTEAAAAATSRAEKLAEELATLRAELDRVTADAAHAAELAKRDAELKDASHARIVAHLTDTVAELKSALHGRHNE